MNLQITRVTMVVVIDVLIVEVIEEGGYNYLCVERKPNSVIYCPKTKTSAHSVMARACNLHRTQTECNIKDCRRKLKYSQKVFETLTKLSTGSDGL